MALNKKNSRRIVVDGGAFRNKVSATSRDRVGNFPDSLHAPSLCLLNPLLFWTSHLFSVMLEGSKNL